MGDTKISLKPETDGPAVYWGDKKLAIPNQREKVVFQKLGHYIIVSNVNLGFNIRWDGRETIFVSVAEEMRGKTCGLCGIFDGNKDNDFTTDIGRVVSSVSNFATTWKKSSQIGQGKTMLNSNVCLWHHMETLSTMYNYVSLLILGNTAVPISLIKEGSLKQ